MALNDDDYSYLASLSAHPKRAGDTSNFNPAFATPLANAIRQARAAGLNVGLESGFREPGQTGSAYDAGGNSSHTYGLASDISGLDGPNGKATQAWAKIAEANGLHNPYGIGDAAEFNHWQLPPQPLQKTPQLLASLQQAKATGSMQNVWSAYNAGGGPSRVGTATPTRPGSYGQTGVALINAELAKRGINPAAATGAIAGLMGESGANLDPTSFNSKDPGGGSGGIGQWNRERLIGNNGMLAFAKNAGIDVDVNNPLDAKKVPLATQAAYLGHELDTTYAGVRDQLKTAQNPQDALKIWVNSYENPADKAAAIAQRSQYLGPVGTALAGGATAPTATAAATPPGTTLSGVPAGALPGFPDAKTSDLFTKGLEQVMGKPGGQGGPGGQDQPPQPSPMLGPPPQARNVSPLIPPAGSGAMSPQTYGQTINSLNAPLQWGSTPIGASPYAVNLPVGGRMAGPPQTVGAQAPQPIGTSLNSLQNMDPDAYQDRLAMLYGAGFGGQGNG